MKYYLSSLHWIDAMTPPIFERIDELISKIEVILGHSAGPNEESSVPETEFSLVSRLPQPGQESVASPAGKRCGVVPA